jgi:integrase
MARRSGVRLTKTLVEELAGGLAAGADKLTYDAEVPGFAVRLRPGKHPQFVYVYRHAGRLRRFGLGTLGEVTVDQARDKAREARRDHRDGVDPAEKRAAAEVRAMTFADAAARYLDDLAERARVGAKRGRASTHAEFSRLLAKVVLPTLGNIPLADVNIDAVERWHRSLATTPAQANRALTVVVAVLRFAERRRWRAPGTLPSRPVERLSERSRAHRLSLADLAKLGAALRAAEAATAAVAGPSGVRRKPRLSPGEVRAPAAVLLGLRLLALTGMRRSEVFGHGQKVRRTEGAGLRWRDVDLEAGEIRLGTAKAGARRVLLATPAVALLRAARPADAAPNAYVCPGEDGSAPYIAVDKVARRIFATAGLPGGLHALRHAFATVAAEAGLGEYIVAGLLGHGRASNVTARYAVPGLDPLRQAAELVAGRIAAALDGREAKVLPFAAGKGTP